MSYYFTKIKMWFPSNFVCLFIINGQTFEKNFKNEFSFVSFEQTTRTNIYVLNFYFQ
jgi:hypothetical protein